VLVVAEALVEREVTEVSEVLLETVAPELSDS
jgi:hypothetical protein